MDRFDLAVIGGGPAGYVAALRGAQLGAKVALIEAEAVGGTCLNVGCIPTKSFLHSAKLLRDVRNAKSAGVEVDGARLNFATVKARRDQIVRRLTLGVGALLKGAGVQVIKGRARLTEATRVVVNGVDGGEGSLELEAGAVVIATGSAVADIPVARLNGTTIVGSTGALNFAEVPPRLFILGGGVIGCEFASVYRAFGSEVTILEAEQQLLPREDPEAAEALAREFRRDGIKLMLGAKLLQLSENVDGTVTAHVEDQSGAVEIIADRALVSVGRRPATAGLGLEELGVRLERGTIVVDEKLQTAVPGIYAAGDVTGGVQLAHVAFHEGAAAAENALGQGRPLALRAVPRCVYTMTELGAVGLTEAEARARYGDVKVGKFGFNANGKALVLGESAGFVKVIAEPGEGRLVGVTIVGPGATELVAEPTLAVALGCTLEDINDVVHAHPTLTEALREATLAAAGRPLHGGH